MIIKHKILFVTLVLLLQLPLLSAPQKVYAKENSTIPVVIGCSMQSSNTIYYVDTIMQKIGYKIPKTITCSDKIAKALYTGNFSEVEGVYFDSYNLIYVKEHNLTNPFVIIYLHELGHFNHRQKLSEEEYVKYIDSKAPPEIRFKILEDLGEHAASNNEEFVAEYFARTQVGYTYPKELQDYYVKNCKGI